MNGVDLKESEAVVLKLTANSLFNAGYRIDETDIDWQSVLDESRKQTVCALAFDSAKGLKLSPEISEKWFNTAVAYFGMNVRVNEYHKYVHHMMTENNIPYCILKGCASEYYYKNPTLRAMGDVDFIVGEGDLSKTKELFKKEGFHTYGHEHDIHLHLKKNSMDFELHFKLPGIPGGEKGDSIRDLLKNIISDAKETKLGDTVFMMPTTLHHGMILLLHTYNHLLFEGIGLRHLCDWAVFVDSFGEGEFEKIFEESLKKAGLWKFARILSATCCKYLCMPYRSWIGEVDENLCKRVILDIFEGGNFGRKNIDRYWQSQMIASRGSDSLGKNKLTQFIKQKNKDAAKYIPFFTKYEFMRPFGWIYIGIRYVINLILGKRKLMNVGELAKGADDRKDIYEQFKLFEEEA